MQKNIIIPTNQEYMLHIPKEYLNKKIEVFLNPVLNKKKRNYAKTGSFSDTNTKQRIFGLYKGKGAFKLKSDFSMTEKELLSL